MSKLEELINKLCPNGVEFMNFNTVAQYIRGVSYGKNKEINNGDKGYKLLRANNITLESNTLNYEDVKIIDYSVNVKETQMLIKNDILICAGSGSKEHIGKVAFINENIDYTFGGFMGVIRSNCNIINPRYLFYIMTGPIFKEHLFKVSNSSTINNINNDTWKNFAFPVPPLEVQCEIVRILDNFTLLSAELSTLLSTELKARQKQFSYYREKLYKSNENIKRLDEVVDIRLGLTHTPKYVENGIKFISAQNTSNDYLNLDHVKYISQKEYDSITDNAKPKRGDILFTRVGSNLGHPVIVETDEKLCMFVSLGYLRIKNTNSVLNTYIKHWINTENFWSQVRKNVHGSAKVNLNTGWLSKFEISIPSIKEQQNIVNILDKFEKLCNDISDDLPAEIEVRKKQYEFYRDKLLTFKELKS